MSTVSIKDPAEVKGYTFDFTPWLDSLGVTISSITSVTPDSGLTVDDSALDSTSKKVTAVYSGGTAGTIYKVVCKVLTSNGYTLMGAMFVPVETK